MEVIECTLQDVGGAASLFNQYRMFYELPDDLDKSRDFLRANLEQERSRIFLVVNEEMEAVAFAQLYPATCSLAMKHFYWLYDLFVDPSARSSGCARMVLDHLANMSRRGSSPYQPRYGKDQSEGAEAIPEPGLRSRG
jgi:GNAT superfamily N-acetyltransferase